MNLSPADKFRSNSEDWNTLSELLEHPVLQKALATLSEVPTELILGLSAHDHSLMLGDIQATARFVLKLHELATPLPQPTQQQRETFGTPHTVDEFDPIPASSP